MCVCFRTSAEFSDFLLSAPVSPTPLINSMDQVTPLWRRPAGAASMTVASASVCLSQIYWSKVMNLLWEEPSISSQVSH